MLRYYRQVSGADALIARPTARRRSTGRPSKPWSRKRPLEAYGSEFGWRVVLQDACPEPGHNGVNLDVIDGTEVLSFPSRLRLTSAYDNDVLSVARPNAIGDLESTSSLEGGCSNGLQMGRMVWSILGTATASATDQNGQ